MHFAKKIQARQAHKMKMVEPNLPGACFANCKCKRELARN